MQALLTPHHSLALLGGEPGALALAHPANATFGWALVLAGFASGALLGLGFHREGFLGGYGSLRRRLLRLGHIALIALGLLNVVYAIYPAPASGTAAAAVAGIGLMVGGVSMPVACVLAAWREPLRCLFPIPVIALLASVIALLSGGV